MDWLVIGLHKDMQNVNIKIEKCSREMFKRNAQEKCSREILKRNVQEKCSREIIKISGIREEYL